MSPGTQDPLVVNGWALYFHPCFLEQLDAMVRRVQAAREKHRQTFKSKKASKLLAAVAEIVFGKVPQDPARVEYRQGNTLGEGHKHWFRVKFYQQYRLFFRYHEASRVIVFAWVNDDKMLRAYESKTDAYRVFANMLEGGRPPGDWDALMEEVSVSAAESVHAAVSGVRSTEW